MDNEYVIKEFELDGNAKVSIRDDKVCMTEANAQESLNEWLSKVKLPISKSLTEKDWAGRKMR